MRRFRVIPVLLLKSGGLYKTTKFKDPKYVGDPINAVRIFNEKEVDEIIILDIDASPTKSSPDLRRIGDIASEAFMPLAYGGGITSVEEVKKVLYEGVEKVIINTAAIDSPSLVEETAKRFGSSSVVVSLDVKKNWMGKTEVYTNNGKKNTGTDVFSMVRRMADAGAGEIFINSIDRDGTFTGYDISLVQKLAPTVDVPLIICGGAASIADFREAIDAGASAVAAGSFFVFQRPHKAVLISYPRLEEFQNINMHG